MGSALNIRQVPNKIETGHQQKFVFTRQCMVGLKLYHWYLSRQCLSLTRTTMVHHTARNAVEQSRAEIATQIQFSN